MLQGRTRAATRATAAEAHADHAEAALAVCLQQPCFRGPNQLVSIRLLAVSKRLAALVARSCAGALALTTRMVKPEHTDALASWLSHHGALLAEMELDCCLQAMQAAEQVQLSQQQHAVVCVLEQLPSSLMGLTLHGWGPEELAAQLAATFARALSRQPMQLRSLVLPRSWKPQAATVLPALAALSQLTSLVMWKYNDHTASAEQLRQLSTLRRLEQLTVHMSQSYDAGILRDVLAALAVLPLTQLCSEQHVLTAACLEHLGACTRLTSLELYEFYLAGGATLQQLAAALARLTALEHLQLKVDDGVAGDDEFLGADWVPVCAALARLPRLTPCRLEWPGLGAAAAQLAAVTQLTELRVWGEGFGFDGLAAIDNAFLATVCAGLTGLRHLVAVHSVFITDGCLGSIAGMPQLTHLNLSDTGVTADGVQQLSAARPSLKILCNSL